MQRNSIVLVILLGLTVTASGCWKKASNEASLTTTTGYDSLATTEELAQLPQSSTPAQQAAIETLPIETTPVTQAAAPMAGIAQTAADMSGLSRDQQIQTALKNAGLYNGNIDGKIGPASRRAIETFQKSNGLKADGKVGPKTWAALEQYLTGSVASATATQTQ